MSASHSHPEKPDSKCCSHAYEEKKREADGHDHSAGVSRPQLWLVGLSGVGIAAGFLAHWTLPDVPWLATLLFTAATITGSVLILPHALESIFKFRLDMNVLMRATPESCDWI